MDPSILIDIKRGAGEDCLEDIGHRVPPGISETVISLELEDVERELGRLTGVLSSDYATISLGEVAVGLRLTPDEEVRFDKLLDRFSVQQARAILGIPPDTEILN